MRELAIITSKTNRYKAIWNGKLIAMVYYTPSAKTFCYRIEYRDGSVGYGKTMDFVERILTAVATRKKNKDK